MLDGLIRDRKPQAPVLHPPRSPSTPFPKQILLLPLRPDNVVAPSPTEAGMGPCAVPGQAVLSGATRWPVHGSHTWAGDHRSGTLSSTSTYQHFQALLILPPHPQRMLPKGSMSHRSRCCRFSSRAAFPCRKGDISPRFPPPVSARCYGHLHQRSWQPGARCCS